MLSAVRKEFRKIFDTAHGAAVQELTLLSQLYLSEKPYNSRRVGLSPYCCYCLQFLTVRYRFVEANIYKKCIRGNLVHSNCCNQLTPWCRVLPEKLRGHQILQKFPEFNGTRRFITVSTTAAVPILSHNNPVHAPSQLLNIHFNIILLFTSRFS
jgi:hypothetical protein